MSDENVRLRGALQRIVDDGDFTAPENMKRIAREALSNSPDETTCSAADYEEVLADHRRLVRELDVALNGDGAARQASLCDIVGQVKDRRWKLVRAEEPTGRETSARTAIEGDLVPDHWWRVHRELANGHISAALAVVAAVLDGRALPECAACNVTALTINAVKATEAPYLPFARKCDRCKKLVGSRQPVTSAVFYCSIECAE